MEKSIVKQFSWKNPLVFHDRHFVGSVEKTPGHCSTRSITAGFQKMAGQNGPGDVAGNGGAGDKPKGSKAKGCLLWGLGIFTGLIVLGILVPTPPKSDKAPEAPASTDASAAAPSAAPSAFPKERIVTSQQLAGAFAANEVAAKGWADGGPVKVTGPIEAIELDMFDNPTVSLTGYQYNQVTAHFGKDASAAIADLRQGRKVTVVCDKVSEVMGAPQLNGCALAD